MKTTRVAAVREFKMDEFLAWLNSEWKDTDTYPICDADSCLLAKFGIPGAKTWTLRGVPSLVYDAVVSGAEPDRANRTIGNLKKRLKAYGYVA